MKSLKLNFSKVSGIIITVCAIGIIALKYFTNGDLDSYILPVILLCVGAVFIFQKPENNAKQIELNPAKRNIILSVLSIMIIVGFIAFFSTL